jgi:hypothetical protein
VRRLFLAVTVAVFLAVSARVEASSDLRARVVVAIDRLEHEINDRKWNLNNLEEKRSLERDLQLLYKLYDRILEHENDIMTFDCSGATVLPGGGPPVSSAGSDDAGSLSLGAGSMTIGGTRWVFARHISDTEIRLLAQLTWIDDRLANERWHLNNLAEKKELIATRERVLSALRRVRNSRC